MIKQLVKQSWIVVAVVACQSSVPPQPEPEHVPDAVPYTPLSVGPERGITRVDQPALAFHPDGDGHAGGYLTHQAKIQAGAIALTPFSFASGTRVEHHPLSLETTSITVDDALIASSPLASRLSGGEVHVERGEGIVERLRNEPDGLHQEWLFERAPEADGDIAVVVSLARYEYQSTTASGLHFRSPTEAIGFRYSHAVWIGANGAEWPIPAEFIDGRIIITVPADVVAQTTFPAVLDPTVSAEVAADAPVIGFTGASSQHGVAAFDGTNYLVVWDDNRNSVDADIWAARVSQAGAVIDTAAIQLANNAGRQQNPAVAFNGTQFVVVWEDFKVAGGVEADIVGATVSTAGAVASLGSIAATATSETQPRIAASGGTALVAWNAAGAINAALRTTGAFGAAIPIATGSTDPAVARNPLGDYIVGWSEGAVATANLRGQFVDTAGALVGAAFDIGAGAGRQFSPSASFDGTNFAFAWTNNNAGINIFGARVTTAGVVLDTHLEAGNTFGGVTVSGAAENQEAPTISCLATGCLVLWQDRRNLATTGFDINAQRLNTDFTLNGAEIAVANVTQNQFSPAVTASGAGFFGVWQDGRDGNGFTVFGATISTAGAVGTNTPLVGGNNREATPNVGRAGGNFGVFWSDSRVFGPDIQYVRFGPSGTKLDVTSRVASNATFAQLAPAASTDLGANSLVVWSDARSGLNKDIFAARVALSNGTVLDANGIQLTGAAGDQLVPDVASNGTVALAVWQDRRSGGFDIFGAVVDSAGAIVAPDFVISNAANDQVRPAVAFDTVSGQFIVVWSDARSGAFHIFGTRVSTAGAVLDAAGVLVGNGAVGQFSPAITSSSAGSFAVWEDRRAGRDIFGTRLTGGASLTVVDGAATGIAVSQAAGSQSAPKVTTLSGFYTVVWVDDRNTQTDIFGQQLTTAGALTGAEFGVSTTTNPESNVTIQAGTTNNARVAYETKILDTSRTNTRVITSTTAGGEVCSGPSQCASGFCVDGRCCDTACGGNDNTDCQACRNSKTGQPDGICSPIPSVTVCRNYASTFCDLREYCDGVSTTCPVDIGRNAFAVCNRSTNVPPGVGQGVCPTAAAPGPHPCI